MLFLVIPVFLEHFPIANTLNTFPDGYNQLASNILAGNGYRFFPDTSETLLRTPGYPLFLALIFYFSPNSLVAAKIANLILGLLTAWIVAILTWRFTAHKVVVGCASLLFLLHPATIFAGSRGAVEPLFTFFTVVFVLAMYRAFNHQKLSDYVIAGMLLGILSLVKSTVILFPIFLLGCVVATRKWKRIINFWMPRLAIMGMVMFLVLLPWIVRNYLLVDRVIPTMTIAGTAAFDGLSFCKNYSLETSLGQSLRQASIQRAVAAKELGLPHRSKFFQFFDKTKDEVRFNNYLLNRVFEEYRNSPILFIRCSLLNMYNFWFLGGTWSSTYLNIVVQVPYLITTVIGVYFCIRQGYWKQMIPIVGFVAYFFIVHLPIIALARFSVPLIPFLAIFSGIAINELRLKYVHNQKENKVG